MYRSIFVLILALLSLAPSFHARAGAGGIFLMPASAALHGRGAVSSFGAMDASDIYRYTANSALAGGTQLLIGYADREGGGTQSVYSAAALPFFYSGALGVFAQRSISPDFDDMTANTFGLSLAGYNARYGYGIGGHAAFREVYVPSRDEDYASYIAFGLDFRVDPVDIFSGRAYFLSQGISGNDQNDNLANEFGVIVNYHPLRGLPGFWDIDLGTGIRKVGEDPFVIGASAKLGIGGMFFARLGYENSTEEWAGISGLRMGAGVSWGGLGIDGAYRFAADSDIGDNGFWTVNAKYEIESMKKRNAAHNHALAQKYYEKRRYKKSAFYAQRALTRDSTHWNAEAILHKSNAELRRKKGNDIAIIYGGNARGIVVPYPPSPDALGGLSRYAAVVSSLRKDNPVNFTIGVGNMLDRDNNELKVELTAGYYDIMQYDAIAPGRGDIAMGHAEFIAAQKRQLPVVITNLDNNTPTQSGISSTLLLTNDGYYVYIMNILTASVLSDSVMRGMSINYDILRTTLKGEYASKANLRVAVVHGNLEEIKRVASMLTDLDIIIAGDLEERLDVPLRVGKTIILSAGAGNKFAGCLTLKFNSGKNRKGRFTATNKLYPVFQDIAPDPAVENMTRLVNAAIKVERGGKEKVPTRVRGIIPHLSDRGHGTQAFIKAVQSKAEYHIGEDFINSRQPIYSPVSNRGAFIFGKSESRNGKLRMVDLATMNGRTVASGRNVMEAAFSPANNFLYYIEADSGSDRGGIYKTMMYMYDAITVLEQDGTVRRDLSISDDGATLLFCSKGGDNRWHINVVDTSAVTAPVRLTSGNADHRYPRISPDGKYIAYLSNLTGFGMQYDLWVLERNSKTHRQITFNANVQDFTWSDNSEVIYFSAGATLFEISAVDVTVGDITFNRLILSGNTAKSWNENTPRFIRYNDAPRIVYTREYINGARRIHWVDVMNGRDEKLYAVGDDDEWLP